MQGEKKIAIVIVPDQCNEDILDGIALSGVKHIMSFDARGTAELAVLQKLGLGRTKKKLIAFMQEKDDSYSYNTVAQAMGEHTDHSGIFFTIFFEESAVSEKTKNLLICVIVNAGYAEAVMQEARKAGARGGTIINARGTGKEQDMDFFGIQIVPEKEMLVMVAEKGLAEELVKAVKELPLLAKPGSGLVFTVAADSVSRLGGSAS